MLLIKEQVGGFANKVFRSRAGLWIQRTGVVVPRHQNVLAILENLHEGKRLVAGANIVTDAGDLFYAQQGAGETPTNDFGAATSIMEVFTAGTPAKGANRSTFTIVAASQKAFTTLWPRTNDPDGDNTGSGTDIVSYLVSWTTGDFNQTAITGVEISLASPGASAPLLMGGTFGSSFNKTASDTLKIFVNHTMNGV